jgi:hypothetical protein
MTQIPTDDRSILDKIVEQLGDEEVLKADGFDNAVIGYDANSFRLIYSVSKCIDVLVEEQGMELDEAIEFFEYNVSGAYVGEKTPIWCQDDFF